MATATTSTTLEVPAKAEEALRSKMKHLAHKQCDGAIRDFVQCSKEAGILVVIKCREHNKRMNECVSDYTTAEVLEGIKRQWVDAGRPSDVGWMPKVTRPS
ncbi:cytochrome c oxidase biogenesis protein Cmc1 [Chloropicon roscoffensis]|uniref:COX assembly mitochondrial protein n=1 Tax=Chloropicon roscoffensis TaxID=1461544 RepID=A0AAX4PLC9_9CHLO